MGRYLPSHGDWEEMLRDGLTDEQRLKQLLDHVTSSLREGFEQIYQEFHQDILNLNTSNLNYALRNMLINPDISKRESNVCLGFLKHDRNNDFIIGRILLMLLDAFERDGECIRSQNTFKFISREVQASILFDVRVHGTLIMANIKNLQFPQSLASLCLSLSRRIEALEDHLERHLGL